MTDTERRKRERRIETLAALQIYVENYLHRIENRFSKWLRRGLIAFGIIALACTLALIGSGILIKRIQDTRRNFVITNCTAQNKRHDKALLYFRAATARSIKRNPQFAKQIKESMNDSKNIIIALAPKQNCKRLAKVALGEANPPPPDETVGRP
jgi:hypothetical protein